MSLKLPEGFIRPYSNKHTILIDADIVAFRSASMGGEHLGLCLSAAYGLIDKIKDACDSDDIKLFFTGKSNFRYDILPSYKGNRVSEKPPLYNKVVEILKRKYQYVLINNLEADDEIAIQAYEIGLDKVVIASTDKDFMIVPTTHYNFIKDGFTNTTELQATAFLCKQCLTGDTADHICGIRGIGPVNAKRLIDDCEDTVAMWLNICSAYEISHGDNWLEALECNLKLLNIGGGYGRYRPATKQQLDRHSFYEY
jgi:DNA polymerase-1